MLSSPLLLWFWGKESSTVSFYLPFYGGEGVLIFWYSLNILALLLNTRVAEKKKKTSIKNECLWTLKNFKLNKQNGLTINTLYLQTISRPRFWYTDDKRRHLVDVTKKFKLRTFRTRREHPFLWSLWYYLTSCKYELLLLLLFCTAVKKPEKHKLFLLYILSQRKW